MARAPAPGHDDLATMAAAPFLPRVLPRSRSGPRARDGRRGAGGDHRLPGDHRQPTAPPPTSTTVAGRSIGQPSPALTAPAPTAVPAADAPTDEAVAAAVDLLVASGEEGPGAPEMDRLALSGDLRQAWVLADALRIADEAHRRPAHRGAGHLDRPAPPRGRVGLGVLRRPAADLGRARPSRLPRGQGPAVSPARTAAWPRSSIRPAALDWRTVTWSGTGADAGPALDAPRPSSGPTGSLARRRRGRVRRGGGGRGARLSGPCPRGARGRSTTRSAAARSWSPTAEPARRRWPTTGASTPRAQMLTADGTALDLDHHGPARAGRPAALRPGVRVGGALDGGRGGERLARREEAGPWDRWACAPRPGRPGWRPFPTPPSISDDAGIGRVYVLDPDGTTGAADPAAWPTGPVDDRLGPRRPRCSASPGRGGRPGRLPGRGGRARPSAAGAPVELGGRPGGARRRRPGGRRRGRRHAARVPRGQLVVVEPVPPRRPEVWAG